jgi:hypothetical protein
MNISTRIELTSTRDQTESFKLNTFINAYLNWIKCEIKDVDLEVSTRFRYNVELNIYQAAIGKTRYHTNLVFYIPSV